LNSSSTTARRGCIAAGGTCRSWKNILKSGDEVFVFGKLVETKPRTMDHPETEVIEGGEEGFIHINRIAPVYPLTEGLPQRWLRGLIWRRWKDMNYKSPNRSPRVT
jgi:RecG-like helicase